MSLTNLHSVWLKHIQLQTVNICGCSEMSFTVNSRPPAVTLFWSQMTLQPPAFLQVVIPIGSTFDL